ncbi:hypothetical protein [Desulfosporosinus shakirovi]|uniref:hypothetical protein n=1 Tax=Desulfosporosinus shakirovi TaxID=2885154 RepID=UPI001E3AE9A2|nr:hypothetical protein [Desulfosporosinus sp. SRJS8]MCB8814203.1 hypothetical protein [Desulfosporosinus sp. SRJS8]
MGIGWLPEMEKKATTTLDALGIASICVGLFCLIFALSKGNQMGWEDPVIVIMLLVGIVSLLVMVVHETSLPRTGSRYSIV